MRDFSTGTEMHGGEPRPGAERYFGGETRQGGVWDRKLTDEECAILAAGTSPLVVAPEHLVYFWD
jgi:hypothetical protein